jgi:hypothetical protein
MTTRRIERAEAPGLASTGLASARCAVMSGRRALPSRLHLDRFHLPLGALIVLFALELRHLIERIHDEERPRSRTGIGWPSMRSAITTSYLSTSANGRSAA